MKDNKRAIRRHHRLRMIARAMNSWQVLAVPDEHRLQRALRFYDNMQRCSCYMCGHTRKVYGPTIQELRRLLEVSFEIELPASASLANWRARLEQHVLLTDLVFVLKKNATSCSAQRSRRSRIHSTLTGR